MPSLIEQIANELNVSSASVSRALNDRPGVSAELRERILEKARVLNYTPSIVARGLATAKSFAIGFFVREKPGLSTQSDPFYGEIMHGVEQASALTDYHVIIGTLTDDILANPAAFRFIRERRVDGIILAGPDIPNNFVMAMSHTSIPVLLVDNCLDYSAISCVNSNDYVGAEMAAQHLIALGHQRIGVIAGPQHWTSTARRVAGYRQALHKAELPLHVTHVKHTTIESGMNAFDQLWAEHDDLTAICAVNDSMAIGAIRAARNKGLSVPQNLSVIGFDDITWAQFNAPSLTTMRIPKQQMGMEAANRLISLINDPDLSPSEVSLAVQLVERDSTQAI